MLIRRALRVPLVATGLAALAVLALGGCDSDSDAASAAASEPAVIVPGKPGEANRTLSAEEAAQQRAEDDSPNSADVSYAQMMIEHHAQALEMTDLAPERAESTKVKRLAERIAAAQEPEIKAMRGWLRTYVEAETGGEHGHGSTANEEEKPTTPATPETADMPGMATEAQLKQLRAAEGRSFDRLFLTLMITHHEGALTMATDVKAQGNNIRIEEMADDVIAQQTSEITRMRDML